MTAATNRTCVDDVASRSSSTIWILGVLRVLGGTPRADDLLVVQRSQLAL
jgi:hypothetical protein